MDNSIQSVVSQALCCACGACAGTCAAGAIHMEENSGGFLTALVDANTCVNCGQCRKVCPSIPENQSLDDLDASFHGPCLEGFIGHASDKRIRREGQSGGIVTALLLYLLESGKIDGAVTNQFDREKRRSQAVYVDSRQALLESCGSYYTQSSVVKTVLEHSDQRLAAVVLGCQAEALSRCRQGRPEYLLGLICAGQNSGHMIDELVKKTGCPADEAPRAFRFRYSHPAYGSWPGNVLYITDKHRYILDKSKRHALKPVCEAYRCLLCYDQMCVGADLVCGDPWGIEGDHSAGETVVIARTEKGLQLLREAADAGYVELSPLAVEKIMRGETVDTQHREKVGASFTVCRAQGWAYPYTVSKNARTELEKTPAKAQKAYLPRLIYTRSRYLAKTPEEAAALTAAYQLENEKAARRQRRKNILLFPLRCARFLVRHLRKK